MNNRQRMRESNKLVRKWLLDNGYDEIWFKPHGKRNDLVFTQRGNYLAQDIWNLFDGICKKDNKLIFLQMSTSNWHGERPYEEWIKKVNGVGILLFLVTQKRKECQRINKDGSVSKIRDWKVFVKEF